MYARRTVLAWIPVGGLLGAGCVGSDAELGVTVEDVEVPVGGTATVAMEATNTGAMRVSEPLAPEGVSFVFEEATWDGRPSKTLDLYPPVWRWNLTQATAALDLPVRATEDASPGTHECAVTVWDDADRDEGASATESFTVAVVEG